MLQFQAILNRCGQAIVHGQLHVLKSAQASVLAYSKIRSIDADVAQREQHQLEECRA